MLVLYVLLFIFCYKVAEFLNFLLTYSGTYGQLHRMALESHNHSKYLKKLANRCQFYFASFAWKSRNYLSWMITESETNSYYLEITQQKLILDISTEIKLLNIARICRSWLLVLWHWNFQSGRTNFYEHFWLCLPFVNI